MRRYILRRILLVLPILFGVNTVLFFLFFVFTTPDRIARLRLGPEATVEQVSAWKERNGYHLPMFYNEGWQPLTVRELSNSGIVQMPDLDAGHYRLRLVASRESKEATIFFASRGDLPTALSTVASRPIQSIEHPAAPEGLHWSGAIRKFVDAKGDETDFSVGPQGTVQWALLCEPGGVQIYIEKHAPLNWGSRITETLFFQKALRFLWFDFGKAEDGRAQSTVIAARIVPTLLITFPSFLIGVIVEIVLALILVRFRNHWIERAGVIFSTLLMSFSILFIAISAQWIFGKELRLFPVTGYSFDSSPTKFLIMPVLVGVVGYMGAGIRWYRAIFLTESDRLYVQRARAFGLDEPRILCNHILRNSIAPVLATALGAFPSLLMGSIALESIFEIPGLGSFTIEAIRKQDFNALQATTYVGSFIFMLVYLFMDLLSVALDPRMEINR